MQTSSKKVSAYMVELTIKENTKEVEKAREEAIELIRKNANIKGFRKGAHIPEDVIIKEYGEEMIRERAVNMLLDKIYQKALQKEGIVPVSAGAVKEVKSESPLEVVLEVEILPTAVIDEKKMKKIKVKKTVVKVEEDEVTSTIAEIEKRFTHFHDAGAESTDGFDASAVAIEKGDRVTIDTQGFEKKDGAAIPETKVSAFPLVIGSGSFIPGFEDKMIGKKVGEIAEFDITFPADYHAPEFKNRKVFFMTTIFRIEKAHKPTWDEDFIEKLRGVRTDFEGFKEVLAKEIQGEKEYQARAKDEHNLLEELMKITELEVGPSLIENEVARVWDEQKHNIESQGYKMSDYLSHAKKDEAMYKEEVVKPEATRRVKAELILKRVREMLGIESDEAEVQEEVAKVIAQYSNTDVITRLRAKLIPGDDYYEDIKNRVTYRKVVDSFFE
ncbi:MAG: Trigger factor [uncultured bacterium (gcode 4)]|uniref:Trigger factor n=1 Tax=uncultured bacterium (gcode 4) TaxID=1234023 RepID=K1XX47_9BACT|nr:MAG: Trigger factor [uncultured bacterium (gcode 4)]